MKDTYFIVFDEDGVDRLRKRPPNIEMGERYVQQTLEVSDDVFGDLQHVDETSITPDPEDVGGPGAEVDVEGLDGVCDGPPIEKDITEPGDSFVGTRFECPECGHRSRGEFGPHFRADQDEAEVVAP